MGVQRVSEKDLIDEYLYRPPSPKQKKKLTKKSWRKSKKKKSWNLSSVLLHKSSPYMYYKCRFWYNWVWSTYLVFLSSQKYNFPFEKCKIWTLTVCADQPEHALKVRYDFSEANCIRDHIIRRDLSKVKTFFLTHPTYWSRLCPFLEISFSPKRGPETP